MKDSPVFHLIYQWHCDCCIELLQEQERSCYQEQADEAHYTLYSLWQERENQQDYSRRPIHPEWEAYEEENDEHPKRKAAECFHRWFLSVLVDAVFLRLWVPSLWRPGALLLCSEGWWGLFGWLHSFDASASPYGIFRVPSRDLTPHHCATCRMVQTITIPSNTHPMGK